MDMDSKIIKSYALEKLKGNWWLAIGVSFVASILGANGPLSFSSGVNSSTNNTSSNFSVIAIAIFLVSAFIGPISELGQNAFYLNLCRNQTARFSDLFSKTSYFFKAFALKFITGLLVILWSFLFIIPGLIAIYRYSMAMYILTDNPEIGVMEAIKKSKEMMEGHKLDLVFLNISFLGWTILCVFSFGIALFFMLPYVNAATAAFYLRISNNDSEYNNIDPQYIK